MQPLDSGEKKDFKGIQSRKNAEGIVKIIKDEPYSVKMLSKDYSGALSSRENEDNSISPVWCDYFGTFLSLFTPNSLRVPISMLTLDISKENIDQCSREF